MFFANDEHGNRVDINSASRDKKYFCPACGAMLVLRKGKIVTHHFSHKSVKICDPWYTNKMSAWHLEMQSRFPPDCREVIIKNEEDTEYHIADVQINANGKKYVFEFQRSQISRNEFELRSQYYLSLGFTLIWVFDFCNCKPPKRIYYENTPSSEKVISIKWPHSDRVRFLDYLDLSEFSNPDDFHLFFHIKTGLGKKRESVSYDGSIWSTWEYKDPFNREYFFVEPTCLAWDKLDEFDALYYSEESFYKHLSVLVKGRT